MHLKLPEKLESYAHMQVTKGLYSSTSEFMRELIRRHMEQDEAARKQSFYEAVQAGDVQLLRGEGKEYSAGYMRNLGAQAKQNVEDSTLTDSPEALPL